MNTLEKRIHLKEIMLSEGCTAVPGVYDAISAKVVEKAGFQAVYMGSYSTAASLLGFPDVGAVTMSEMVFHAKNVAGNIDIPLICDAENGFFNTPNIWRAIRVSAIHVEDHEFGKHTNLKPVITDPDKMCKKIKACCDARTDKNFLIFARTDTPWATGDIEDVLKRSNMYLEAGADAIFLAGGGKLVNSELRKRINGPVVVTNEGLSVNDETDRGFNISLYWPMMLYSAFVACKETGEMFIKAQDYSKLGKYVFDEPEFNKYIPFGEFLSRVENYAIKS